MTKIPLTLATVMLLFGPFEGVTFGADIGYSGRLTDSVGKPVGGAIDLEFRFFDASSNGTQLSATINVDDVPLAQGAFSVTLTVPDADSALVFGGAETWIQIKDKTNDRTMPRQRFLAVPHALRVPVDGVTMSYNNDGKLRMGPAAPGAVSYLKIDAGGNLSWEAGGGGLAPNTVDAASIQDDAVVRTKIIDDAIDGSKIEDGTVGNVDIAALDAAKLTGNVAYARLPVGTAVNTVAAGNDVRFTDSRVPNGSAGGKLSGSYPNPGVNLAVTDIPTLTSAKISDFAAAAAAQDTNAKTFCGDGAFLRGEAATTCRTAAQIIGDGGGLTSESDPQVGTNTTNYVSKWDGSALVASGVYDNGTNVGVGTASPARKLHVHEAAASNVDVHLTNATTGALLSDGFSLQVDASGHSYLWNRESTDIYFGTDNLTRMTIDETGKVGIGTPGVLGSELEVRKDQNVRSEILISNQAVAGNTSAQARLTAKSLDSSGFVAAYPSDFANSYVRDRMVLGSNADATGVNVQAPLAGQDIRFFAGDSTEDMRIDSAGNVGIGIVPTAKLHVGGTAGVDGIKFPDGTVQTTAATGSSGMRILQSQFVNSAASVPSSNTTFVDYVTYSFTPQSATSKIRIRAQVSGASTIAGAAAGPFCGIRLVRDAVALGAEKNMYTGTSTEGAQVYGGMGFLWQENSPGTSAVSYKVQFRRANYNYTCYLYSGELLVEEIE